MTGKPIKLSQRKQSKLAVEKYLDATDALSRFTNQQIVEAKATLVAQKLEDYALPLHIRLLRKHGIQWGVPVDSDVEKLIEAESLLKREIEHPGDLVSSGTFSASQKANRDGEPRGESDDYPSDEIQSKALSLGYFDLPEGDRKKRKIRDQIVKSLGLDVRNKATLPESRDRHMRRILGN